MDHDHDDGSPLNARRPTKFDLTINMKTARALGLTIPPAIRACADRLIESCLPPGESAQSDRADFTR
jgi:hypothetical protein